MKHSLINEDLGSSRNNKLAEGSQLSSNKAGIEAPICYLQPLSTLFYSWLLKIAKSNKLENGHLLSPW